MRIHQGQEPVSPTSQVLESGPMSLCAHGIAEMERVVDVSHAKQAIKDIFLHRNPRFSCIMKKNRDGVDCWEKTEVNVDDHVFVPEFPAGLNEYDELVNEYISTVELRQLPRCRPLWEYHFINYRTSNAEATVIIKFHHAIGDGASLMSLAFECATPASESSGSDIGVTPSASQYQYQRPSQKKGHLKWPVPFCMTKLFHRLCVIVVTMWYTLIDLQGLTRTQDSKLSMRGHAGVEHLPRLFSSATLHMDDILRIKNCIGGTVNDVIMGVVFYGFQRYLQISLSKVEERDSDPDKKMEGLRLTALVLQNTRAHFGPKKVQGMLKSNTKAPWGNSFGFLHVSIPMRKADDPLDHVRRAKHIMDKKKMSLATFLMSRVMKYVTKLRGSQASGKVMYNTLLNTTVTLSSLVGPTEKVMVAGYPVKSFFFSVSGVPQTFMLTSVSYMDSVRLQVITTKGYADAQLMATCFTQCFHEIMASLPSPST